MARTRTTLRRRVNPSHPCRGPQVPPTVGHSPQRPFRLPLQPDKLCTVLQLPQLEVLCKVGYNEKRLPEEDQEMLMEARRVRDLFASAHQTEIHAGGFAISSTPQTSQRESAPIRAQRGLDSGLREVISGVGRVNSGPREMNSGHVEVNSGPREANSGPREVNSGHIAVNSGAYRGEFRVWRGDLRADSAAYAGGRVRRHTHAARGAGPLPRTGGL
eukprot:2735460-Pyramimonas_sp.AAC.1